jgi:hypothetical protein
MEFFVSRLATWIQDLQRSGIKLLVAYVLLGAAIFALQLSPYPGVFLMILGGPIWIGLLIHFAMAHFAWLAVRRTISKAWLVLPLGFYGSGFALHLVSLKAAQAEAAAINARNASLHLSVEQPFSYLREGPADSFPLIEHYRVDRSFMRQGKQAITTTYYAHGADCDNAAKGYYYQRRFEPWAFRKDIFYFYHGSKTKQCILSQDSLSAEWHYRIKASYTYAEDRAAKLFGRWGKSFEIFDEREQRLLGTIEVATLWPYPAVPWIFAGCVLNGGGPAWQCSWGMAKGGTAVAAGYKQRAVNDPQTNPFTPSLDAETWEVTQLAKALGLEQRQPTD